MQLMNQSVMSVVINRLAHILEAFHVSHARPFSDDLFSETDSKTTNALIQVNILDFSTFRIKLTKMVQILYRLTDSFDC